MQRWAWLGLPLVLLGAVAGGDEVVAAAQAGASVTRPVLAEVGLADALRLERPSAPSRPSYTCRDVAPPDAPRPPAPPRYSGGTCPELRAGRNEIVSGQARRAFVLVTPEEMAPGASLPLMFMWHWLRGSPQSFAERGEVQLAANRLGFIAVLPEEKGDLRFTWPIEASASEARIAEELLFFDDMLACVSEQLSVNAGCVSTMGMSAGALFTSSVLAGARAEYLSSFVSLSGGVGGAIRPWTRSARRLPALVLWGGPSDDCFGVVSFEAKSRALERGLEADGHALVECIHNCGHTQPPAEGTATLMAPVWRFLFDHPYGLAEGSSPYRQQGLPAELPRWCGLGAGSATIRTGACTTRPACARALP